MHRVHHDQCLVRNSLRNAYVGLAILVFTSLVIGCGSKNRDDGSMLFWSSNNPEEISFAQTYVDQWNTTHPHASISFQPIPEGQSSEEIILAAVVGKTTPDIYANMWQGDVEDYARAGVLVALDTIEGFMEFMNERCAPEVIEEIRASDGHIYQVPWKVNPIMMLSNRDILRAAGVVDTLISYSEFLDAAERVTEDRNGDGYYDLWMGYTEVSAIWWQRLFNFVPLYYAASGGAPLVENGKATFDNAHGIKVFSFLQRLYRQGYFPKEQMKGKSDIFLAQKIAVRFTGPWSIRQIEAYKREDFDYSFGSVPVPDDHEGPVYTYCDPKNIVIFNTCRNPQLAWSFLETMLSDEADLDFLTKSSQLPRRKDLVTNEMFHEYFRDNPGMIPFAEQSRYLKGVDSSPYMKEVLDLISQEYEACVVFGKKTPEKAIKDAAQAVNLLYLK